MGWSGYFTLFLVLTANLIDVERESLNSISKVLDEECYQVKHDGLQETALSNLLNYLDQLDKDINYNLNPQTEFGGFSDGFPEEDIKNDNLPGKLERENSDANHLSKQPDVLGMCYPTGNGTIGSLEMEVDANDESFKRVRKADQEHAQNIEHDHLISGKENGPDLKISQKMVLECRSELIIEPDYNITQMLPGFNMGCFENVKPFEIKKSFGNSSYFDKFPQDPISECIEDKSDITSSDQYGLDFDESNPSVVKTVSCVIYDHITEPVKAWWADNWAKYLRQYIKDTKYVWKSMVTGVHYTIKQIPNQGHRFCLFVSNSSAIHLDALSFELVVSMFEHLLLESKSSVLSLLEDVVEKVAELCNPDGKFRLAIRHFMHNKDFRFNYFWYCFYTLLNTFDIILMFHVVKKITTCTCRVLHLGFGMLTEMFCRVQIIDTGVGTEPYASSIITVDVDDLQRLVENQDTENHRSEEIQELEEQIECAEKMAAWSAGKRAGLSEMIDMHASD